jgi:hypothetical protein
MSNHDCSIETLACNRLELHHRRAYDIVGVIVVHNRPSHNNIIILFRRKAPTENFNVHFT